MKLFCQIEITSALTSAYKVHFVFKSKRVYSILLQVKSHFSSIVQICWVEQESSVLTFSWQIEASTKENNSKSVNYVLFKQRKNRKQSIHRLAIIRVVGVNSSGEPHFLFSSYFSSWVEEEHLVVNIFVEFDNIAMRSATAAAYQDLIPTDEYSSKCTRHKM